MVCTEGQLSLRCFLISALGLIFTLFYFINYTELMTLFVCGITYFTVASLFLYYQFTGSNFQISIHASFLGFVFGTGCLITYFGTTSWKPFGCYAIFMAIFHFSEYYAVSISNPKSLSTDLFMLNHSVQYGVAAASSWLEFVIEVHYWPGLKEYTFITIIGIALCVAGELMRKMAIITASSNFNHLVQFYKASDHKLVTHGIYRFMRHPSYVGWFWWSIGTQITLVNPICIGIYTIASWKFFSERVLFEEIALINFFGHQYIEYQDKVRTGLPFIKGYVLE